ncbi:RDD family protein [Corynebacterium sp. zg-331]|uniref:RDD family protein n=1 Tax=unclassified Corynebacterium TaxID=2624378 RepID=UPI00128C111A|nr:MULTISPECIES: RDD family protein [unclassified Corynebacterium]MBC3185176.1 RDD family protein [Corynebacterium sp. zg-331]MPV51674.1 RDD family protein [Corynebacterium sp. zg331]
MDNPKRSWLDGPQIPSQFDGPGGPGAYPGANLGLPRSGPGSLGTVARRAGGVFIDWVIAWTIAGFVHLFTHALGGVGTMTYLFFALIGILTGWLFARTPGQAILGMGIARIDATARVGLWRAVVRTLLTCLIFPAALVDSDGRGMHDRATGTAVIRA